MRPPRVAILLGLLSSSAAFAAGKSPLPKGDVLRALRAKAPAVSSVSEVLADVGGGRFPVLFWVKGNACIERTVDGAIDKNCSPTATPHVAIVKRDAAGSLSVEADLALPTAETPWTIIEEPKWGISVVKDWDGDGKPELAVIYGYNGPNVWAIGYTSYRTLALVNLADALSLSVAVVIDQHPQATVVSELTATWKFLPGGDGKPALQLKVTEAAWDDGKSARVPKSSTLTYGWDAATDQYVKR